MSWICLSCIWIYLNIRDPRFSDVFAPYQGFGEFSEHMRILEIGQIYAGGLKTVLVKTNVFENMQVRY